MKTQLNLNELAAEITRRQDAKKDYVLNTKALSMLDTGALVLSGAEQLEYKANEVAHGQIAERLGIPAKYYGKMRAEQPELLARNVNTWLQANPKDVLLRTLDGQARALLSNRYQRIENEEIAEIILPILAEQPDMQIVSAAITDTRMHIKAIFPRIEGEVARGDVVQAGVAISNSEVGYGAVKIEPLIYRLVCTNGMIMADAKYTARHVGGAMDVIDGVYTVLSDEALQADDRAKLLKVRDVVRASADAARFAQYVTDMQGATQEKLQGDPAEAIKVLAQKIQLSKEEAGGVLRHLIEGGDISRYGVLNAVTRQSQDVADYDRATTLEAAGAQILYMPRKEWLQVAQAA